MLATSDDPRRRSVAVSPGATSNVSGSNEKSYALGASGLLPPSFAGLFGLWNGGSSPMHALVNPIKASMPPDTAMTVR